MCGLDLHYGAVQYWYAQNQHLNIFASELGGGRCVELNVPLQIRHRRVQLTSLVTFHGSGHGRARTAEQTSRTPPLCTSSTGT